MQKEVNTTILINVTPEKVWTILTAFENYPHWNPFITSVKGDVEEGKRITVRLGGADGRTFKPIVLAKKKAKVLVLARQLICRGLLSVVHIFELKETEKGRTRFIQRLKIKGLLACFVNKGKIERRFNEMNIRLKRIVEG